MLGRDVQGVSHLILRRAKSENHKNKMFTFQVKKCQNPVTGHGQCTKPSNSLWQVSCQGGIRGNTVGERGHDREFETRKS